MQEINQRVAIVYGTIPSIEELEQWSLAPENIQIDILTSHSIGEFIAKNAQDIKTTIYTLPDHEENTTFLPGLESVLSAYDAVIVKGRIGIFAYQAIKAKWRSRFKLYYLLDNLCAFPVEDVRRLKTIRDEVMHQADGFITQSKAMQGILRLEGVSEEKILYLAPSIKKIEKEKISRWEALEKLGLSMSQKVILYNGEIEWEEHLHVLFFALKNIMQKNFQCKNTLKIIVMGMGTFSEELKKLSIKLGVDEHILYLPPTRENYKNALAACDAIYISSSPARDHIDGDPFVFLRAMANNVPVICSRSELTEEYIGKHRIDFCPGSYRSLSMAIDKALTNKSLVLDIVAKNKKKYDECFNNGRNTKDQKEIFSLAHNKSKLQSMPVDEMILEAEQMVRAKKFLDSVHLISEIFKRRDIPDFHLANLYRLMGDCFTQLSDYDAARAAYIKSIEFDSYFAKSHIGLGTISLATKKFDIAIVYFQKAISLSPQDEMANMGLGLAFEGLEDITEAVKWIEGTLEINIENTAALYSLVKIAHDTGDYEKGIFWLNKYLLLHPDDPEMLYALSGLYLKEGDFEEVRKIAEKILSMNPNSEHALALIKQINRAQHRFKHKRM